MTALENDALDERLITTDQLATASLVVVAMAVVATTGFRTVFSSTSFLLQSVIGAVLAALVVVAGHRFRLLFGEVVGLALLSPLIVGPLAVGGAGFYRGLATGWAEVLSATPPIDAGPELRALPFIAAFLGSIVGCELERLRYLPGVAIVGPLATLTLTALFTEQTRVGALAIGLVLLIGLLILARLRHAAVTNTGLLVLGLVLGLVSAMASMAGLFLPYADESRRFDLRQLQSPPWDPLSVPSPLTEIKAGLKAAGTDEVPILMVRGDTPATRWRVASLPGYNGVYWGVSGSSVTSEFVSIDSSLPPIEGEASAGAELRFDVDVLAPVGHWVPVPGVPSRVEFDGPTDVRMSLDTGTIAIPDQLQAGDSYEVRVRNFVALPDETLRAVEFVPDGRSAELELLPPVVRNVAADFTTGVDQLSGARVIAIRDSLRLGSYDLAEPPGHSFGRVAEFLLAVQASGGQRVEADLRPMSGYEELYAATAAVVARLSDVPSRVAVGYVIPEERWKDRRAEIFASDIERVARGLHRGFGLDADRRYPRAVARARGLRYAQ